MPALCEISEANPCPVSPVVSAVHWHVSALSSSHLFHILLPLCRHLLPPSSHLLSNLITTSHSPTFLPGLRPVVRPLRQLTEHCPQAGRSILRFHRIETLHIPHPLNHPHFVYPHYIKATLSQSKQSIRICLL